MKSLLPALVFFLPASILFSGCIRSMEDVYGEQDRYLDDLKAIDNYLAENSIEPQIDPGTGIRYVVREQGTGLTPYIVDSVTIDLSGSLLSNGVTFKTESSIKKRWSELLDGAMVALSQIREGGSVTAYVPSFYGYGQQEAEGVPANSILILELSLHEVHDVRLRKDIAAIDDSLKAWGITANAHPSGIRYVLEQGTGVSPTVNNVVTVNYEGRLLGASTNFDAGTGARFRLSNLIAGWKIILPLVKEGGSVTMYVPSVLGYGSEGSGAIPPHSNLVFELTLTDVQ